MAESEFRLPHEQLSMSEKNMPDLAAPESAGMDQAQSSGERISNPSHIDSSVKETDRLDVLPQADTSSTSQHPEEPEENQENRRTEGVNTTSDRPNNVPMEGPWTQQYANNRRKEKELRDQMGLPPPSEATARQGPDSTEKRN